MRDACPVPQPARFFAMSFRVRLVSSMPVVLLLAAACAPGCADRTEPAGPGPAVLELTHDELRDRIRGGWAGQVIGVTYGGPTEFQFNGTFMNDADPIAWDDSLLSRTFRTNKGLFDDVYMDLTFVEVLQAQGLDAPGSAFARAFAERAYPLWHANQAARVNILAGLEPPATGHWKNNPHADDIDFQIEADFAGLMAPGLPNSAAKYCDTVGHVMNYGDGYYGGVFVAGMYSAAFLTTDVEAIVGRGLALIPPESLFHRTISDVIAWHAQYPDDWRRTWFEIQKKWSSETGCPDGVFRAFNIDARLNAAYVVLGLLYGRGDFGRTVDIATRAGQDSDCNPATAAGILGTAFGYSGIPEEWKRGLSAIESLDFAYTTTSLSEAYELSYGHALEVVRRAGGEVSGTGVRIPVETPVAVPFEQSFEGTIPTGQRWGVNQWAPLVVADEATFEFEGTGFTLSGQAVSADGPVRVDVFIDGLLDQSLTLETDFQVRRETPAWRFGLENGRHTLRFVVRNPAPGTALHVSRLIWYGPTPVA